jgi:hypothetical protein
MTAVLTAEVLADELAVSIARALATANRCATEAGVDVAESLISISQQFLGEKPVWRVNYGPRDYVGIRGGDVLVDVDARNGSITRVLRGQ